MRRLLRPVLVLALAALAATAACGGTEDVSRQQFRDALEDGGLPAEHADCATDAVFAELDQSDINDYYGDGEVASEVEEAVATAVEGCP